MRGGVRDADITLKIDRCIPSVSFPQDSDLLNHKTTGDGSMQVNGNCSNLRQFDMQTRYWILFVKAVNPAPLFPYTPAIFKACYGQLRFRSPHLSPIQYAQTELIGHYLLSLLSNGQLGR